MILHVFVNLILYIHVYKKKQDTIDQISHYFLLQKSSQGSSTKHANSICTFIINHIEYIYINTIIILISRNLYQTLILLNPKRSPTQLHGVVYCAMLC